MGLVTELRLGLGRWLGLGLGLITDLSSGTYIDACSDFVPELRLGLGLRARVKIRVRVNHRSFFGNINRCMLGLLPELRLGLGLGLMARVRVRFRSETCSVNAESTIRVQSPNFLRENASLRDWGSSPY